MLTGRHDSYAYIIKEYESMVYHVCLKIAREENTAKELTHVVFTKAFYSLSSYRAEAAFGTWLYRITVRSCLDWKKSVQRESNHRSTATYEQADPVFDESPEQIFLDRETKAELLQMVSELNEPYKSVIYLFFFRGLSYKEISEKTGAAEKTIESQLYRAKQILRKKKERFR